MKNQNHLRKRANAFHFALSGLGSAWKSELHFRLQSFAAIAVLVLGIYLELTIWEWCIILMCIGGVLSMECVNTALEKLCDHLHPEIHPAIKSVKDISAAAVLIASITALTCGMIIFLPYLLQ